MKYIDHIGIAVADLEEAIQTYERLLGTSCYKRERVEQQQVETAFFKAGDEKNKIELLGATDPASVIAQYVTQKGEGIHHVAFEVEDVRAELKRLRNDGFKVLSEEPVRGADDKLVAFIHPKDNHGVLIELCESIA